jgi:hypothetical protein
MQIKPEKIHHDHPRKFYWTRVRLTFEDGSESTVLVGAGKNYLADHFKVPSDKRLQESHIDEWLQEALVEIAASIKDSSSNVYYKVYHLTDEGRVNGMKFLMEEVVP